MTFTVFQKLIFWTEKLFVSIYSIKKYFTMFYIQSLALYLCSVRNRNKIYQPEVWASRAGWVVIKFLGKGPLLLLSEEGLHTSCKETLQTNWTWCRLFYLTLVWAWRLCIFRDDFYIILHVLGGVLVKKIAKVASPETQPYWCECTYRVQ